MLPASFVLVTLLGSLAVGAAAPAGLDGRAQAGAPLRVKTNTNILPMAILARPHRRLLMVKRLPLKFGEPPALATHPSLPQLVHLGDHLRTPFRNSDTRKTLLYSIG